MILPTPTKAGADDLDRRVAELEDIVRAKMFKPEDFPEGSKARAILKALQHHDAERFARVMAPQGIDRWLQTR